MRRRLLVLGLLCLCACSAGENLFVCDGVDAEKTKAFQEAFAGSTRVVLCEWVRSKDKYTQVQRADIANPAAVAALINGVQAGKYAYATGGLTSVDLVFYKGETSRGQVHVWSRGWVLYWETAQEGQRHELMPTPESHAFLDNWLTAQGIPDPDKTPVAREAARLRAQKNKALSEKWLAAMPEVMRPFWQGKSARLLWMAGGMEPEQKKDILAALVKAYPEAGRRIRVLLEWYGSGSDECAYEWVPCRLLMDYATPQILAALENGEWTPLLTAGAARFFDNGDFERQRPEDMKLIPPALKARLSAYARQSADVDKRLRAQTALEP